MVDNVLPDSRYFAHVKKLWSTLPLADYEDKAVSPDILDSWRRCVDSGLTKDMADHAMKQLINSATPFGGDNALAAGQHTFELTDGKAQALFSVVETPDSESFSLAEKRVGTNAPSLAYRLKRGVFVSGPEHYAQCLHDRYSYAEPILNTHQKVCGVCCVGSSDYEYTRQMSSLVHVMACIGDTIYWIAQDSRINEAGMKNMFERVPQGIVYIDSKNVIKHFNQRALAELGLRSTSEDRVMFAQCITLLQSVVKEGCQSAVVDCHNQKREIDVTAIPMPGSKYERLLILEGKPHSRQSEPTSGAAWTFDDIHTASPVMSRAKERAYTAALHSIPVMLIGASGTGKEMFAQAIHNASPRREMPFIALNSSAIAPHLVESTLFGYEKGAFTGASQSGKEGYFEAASGGTLFLDELDSMPFDVQTKLLRALSSKSIRRVGGTTDIPVDVRIVSAGRVDFLQLVEDGHFREDLYYRLSPIRIRIPPLSERPEDITALSSLFLEAESQSLAIRTPKMSKEFIACLSAYSWPGNARELRNVLRHTLIFSSPDEPYLQPELLPDYIPRTERRGAVSRNDEPFRDDSLLKQAAMVAVCETLKRNDGDTEKASKQLGISKATVYNYLSRAKKLNLI